MFRASVARTAQCALIALQMWHSQLYRPPLSLCLSRWVTAPPARPTLAANITNIPCETFGWDVLMSWYISTTFLLSTYNGTDVREKSDLSLPLHISWDGLPWYLVQSLNTKVRGRHVERSPPGDCPQSALSLHWELQYKDIVLAKNVNCWRPALVFFIFIL